MIITANGIYDTILTNTLGCDSLTIINLTMYTFDWVCTKQM